MRRRATETVRVGIREFREKLARFLESPSPVAITRHGETVGFYIPAWPRRKDADLEALRRAAAQLDALVEAAGASEDELVKEFKELRRGSRKAR
ncbi:MAG: type II toxin-antitoxin system Phd/YefM family antitoxin [Acidobacteriota bacterium]